MDYISDKWEINDCKILSTCAECGEETGDKITIHDVRESFDLCWQCVEVNN